jgi:hypothetical protein
MTSLEEMQAFVKQVVIRIIDKKTGRWFDYRDGKEIGRSI